MRAVGFKKSLPISDPKALIDIELERPEPRGRDLLVAVAAVSVNPVDTKVRRGGDPAHGEGQVLGWDAAGTVAAVGPDASLFKPGDAVYYAGSRGRPGCNAEFHLVDERIVGPKPSSLTFAEAAALPLTAITASELLFDRIGVKRGDADRRSLLIVGGAGGVGSMAIQLARKLTALTVIATASRRETDAWVRRLGAHGVVDHSKGLAAGLKALSLSNVDIVLALSGTTQHAAEIAQVIAPQGHLGLIEGAAALKAFDPAPLFSKSIGIHLELMFTRAMFETPDMIAQHRLLVELAALVDRGAIRTTLSAVVGPIDAAHLMKAHALLESGKAIGKLVLEGWPG